ncbi:MAG TPA: hypothetical protein PKJ36_11555 [Flavihumibacter sp.]|nr:hypothetical protein [Flavihumibacter sp.]
MRKIFILIMGLLLLIGCQRDETTGSPKARIAIINMALSSDSVNLLLDDIPLLTTPVAFGEISVSSQGNGGYIETAPGIRNSTWVVGGEAVSLNKFVSWNAGAYYTLVHYDSVDAQQVAQLLIVTDAPSQNDSVGRVRFINCYRGGDSISLWMHRINVLDTLGIDTAIQRLVNKKPFVGRDKSVSGSFNFSLRPGNWQMMMKDRFYNTLFMDTVTIKNNELYSILAVGQPGGTGDLKPQMKLLLQMK